MRTPLLCCVVGALLAPVFTVAAGEPTPTITIVTSGTGADEKGALKQAFSNAIQQAVGTIVDAETVVKNDRMIREQILTASNAIVSKYDLVGSPTVAEGLVTVKIKAVIERKTLTERLAKASVIKAEVRGQDLFAQAVTDLEREKDAAKIVQRVFRDFPGNVLKAEPVGQPTLLDKSKGTIGVKIRLSVDPVKYAAWHKAYLPALKKIGTRHEQSRWDPATSWSPLDAQWNQDRYPAVPVHERQGSFVKSAQAKWNLPGDFRNNPYLVVIEKRGSSVRHLIYIDKEVQKQLAVAIHSLPILEVSLRDKDNKEIDGTEHVVRFRDKADKYFASVFFDVEELTNYTPLSISIQEELTSQWVCDDVRLREGLIVTPYLQGWGRYSSGDCALLSAIDVTIPLRVGTDRLKDVTTVEAKIYSRNNVAKANGWDVGESGK